MYDKLMTAITPTIKCNMPRTIKRVPHFKYLGTSMEEEGGMEIGRNAAEYCAIEGCQ